MSYTCVVPSCNSRRIRYTDKATATKFFSFPKDPVLRSKWHQLFQMKEDNNRKICIKHFKEDDFVDGLKARLMCVQPKRLKIDAVPSLSLSPKRAVEDNQKQKNIVTTYICEKKDRKIPNSKSMTKSDEYLSKLVPIAPKDVKKVTIITQKDTGWSRVTIKDSLISLNDSKKLNQEDLPQNESTPLNPHSNTFIIPSQNANQQFFEKNLNSQISTTITLHKMKVLQHDNMIYKKKIYTLMENQKKLLAQIKNVEAKIEDQKKDFIVNAKEAFSKVFSSNQIDFILGQKKNIWWTDYEFSKAIELLNISKEAYKFVRNTIKYPLPCIPNLYKWSMKQNNKHSRDKKCAEIIENTETTSDDLVIGDLDVSDVKNELKKEYIDDDVVLEYEQDLNENEYHIEVNGNHCGVEYDKVKNHLDENACLSESQIDHNDYESPMEDEDDEFHEELLISYDSDDYEAFDDLSKEEHSDKDNG